MKALFFLPRNVAEVICQLLAFFRPYRGQSALMLAALLAEMGVYTLIPLGFKLLIDRGVVGRDRHMLTLIVAGLAVGILLVLLTGLARDYLYAHVGQRVVADVRRCMFDHLQRLSMDYFGRTEVGDLMARFSTDLAAVEQAITMGIPWGICPVLEAVGSSVILFVLDWRLALPAMLVWPICLLGPRLMGPRAAAASYERKTAEAQTMATLHENLSAQAVIKGYGLERIFAAGFGQRNEALLKSSVRVGFLNALLERSAGTGILTMQVGLIAFGAKLALEGDLTLGTLAAFQGPFHSLSYALLYGSQYLPTLNLASGGMVRIQDLLNQQPAVVEAPGAEPLAPLARQIELREVEHHYPDGRTGLNGINMTIPQGSFVGLVGTSGSGKSTILQLLMRFTDPTGGAVRFDGRDLREATQESLRAQIGFIFQDTMLFNISLLENIRLGKPVATDQEVIGAATLAEMHQYIMSLPQGYQTLAGERGSRLSGGQRQRVGIARAILRNPGILLLDEATSALDPETRAGIEVTVNLLRRGRTVISVTHRLSSLAAADLVYVLDKGQVVEHGDPEELLASDGMLARMWKQSLAKGRTV